MSIAAGTPTVFDQIKASWDALTGHATSVDQTVLAGLQAEFTNALGTVEGIFGPTLVTIEQDAQNDVLSFLTGIAKAVPIGSVTSLSQIVNVVVSAAKALGGPIATQIGALESTALQTLVGAAAVAAGHVKLS